MNKIIVTTSWDDGHKLDIKLAALLKKYGIAGTFYVAPHNREFNQADLLNSEGIIQISRDFEIGAHTMTHPRLPQTSDKLASQEIAQSKTYLEELIGQPVTTFCYPRGEYEPKHVKMVQDAGFRYARTVKRDYSLNQNAPLFESQTTINAYSHLSDVWEIAKFANFNPLKFFPYLSWDNLAIAIFDRMLEEGGIYHLWGHSWEVDKLKYWSKLERVLAHIAHRAEADYVPNRNLS